MNTNYPKPKESGGKIIRSIKASLKDAGITTPIDSHILIAFSGGVDSAALAVAMLKYGRRVAFRDRIRLLHVIHDWDLEKSKRDLDFVRSFAERWGVELIVRRAEPPPVGVSWENWGREQRAKFFTELTQKGDWVMTAHTGDDVAETHLWRFLSGTWTVEEQGILPIFGSQIRPLLRMRKNVLREFLVEEGESWIEDPFNEDVRFQRVFIRKKIVPEIEKQFPKVIENLMKYSSQVAENVTENKTLKQALKDQGLRINKGTWNEINGSRERDGFSVDLPGGYRLIRQNVKADKKNPD